MNVVKVEKTRPCLKVGCLQVKTAAPYLQRPVALCCTEGPYVQYLSASTAPVEIPFLLTLISVGWLHK